MIPCNLLAGTADGIRRVEINDSGAARIVATGLHGQAIRGMAVHPLDQETIFVAAGLRGWGLHLSRDGGASFETLGFEDHWCWDVAIDPANPERILVGTEPPMLWESVDGGVTWRDLPGIEQVESRKHWTFFHAPFHAGHLHGIALTAQRPERIVVGVEHGGLLLSEDRGETWTDVMPGADMHRLEIHPSDPDYVYAGAGNGLFESSDGGRTWSATEGLRGKYIHGIVIDPEDPQRMFVYVDSSQCPIYRSLDGGVTWEPVGSELPSSRPADPIRLHPREPETLFYAGDRDDRGTLYISENNGDTWQCIGLDLPKIWRLQTFD